MEREEYNREGKFRREREELGKSVWKGESDEQTPGTCLVIRYPYVSKSYSTRRRNRSGKNYEVYWLVSNQRTGLSLGY